MYNTVLPEAQWRRANPRRKVSGSGAVRRRNFSCRVSWAAERAAATNRPRSRSTAAGSVVSATPKTRWYTTGNRAGTGSGAGAGVDAGAGSGTGADSGRDGDGGSPGGGHRRRHLRRPTVATPEIRAGPTVLRRTSPVPRPSSSPVARVPADTR